MSARIKIEISAKDVEKKDMLGGISDIIAEPCQEISSVQISYSEEEEEGGGDTIEKVSTDVTAKYISWKEILEKINEIDDDVWQEISAIDISYTENIEED